MQQMTLTLQSESGEFPIPWSSGYQTYSGLLSAIDTASDDVATELHETSFSGLSNSGLLGDEWGSASRDYHHTIQPAGEATYELQLGVIHPDDRDVFEALMSAFVIQHQHLELAHGELSVVQASSDQATHSELLARASDIVDDAHGVRLNFVSPTCRQRYGDVWEAVPHRIPLFNHLLTRWNKSAPEQTDELSLTDTMVGNGVYPKTDSSSYDTHTMVVYRDDETDREVADGDESEPNHSVASDGGRKEVQGYVGSWEFRFKHANEATQVAILALSKFAEYAGVGRHTARGGGAVQTDILGVDI
jgi:hypothetical protein